MSVLDDLQKALQNPESLARNAMGLLRGVGGGQFLDTTGLAQAPGMMIRGQQNPFFTQQQLAGLKQNPLQTIASSAGDDALRAALTAGTTFGAAAMFPPNPSQDSQAGAIDMNAPVGGSPGSTISDIEEAGWKPGLKAQFDAAMLHGDAPTMQKLMPDVPADYQARFADNIKSTLGSSPLDQIQQAVQNPEGTVRNFYQKPPSPSDSYVASMVQTGGTTGTNMIPSQERALMERFMNGEITPSQAYSSYPADVVDRAAMRANGNGLDADLQIAQKNGQDKLSAILQDAKQQVGNMNLQFNPVRDVGDITGSQANIIQPQTLGQRLAGMLNKNVSDPLGTEANAPQSDAYRVIEQAPTTGAPVAPDVIPTHQKMIFDALNKGDIPGAMNMVNAIPDTDPYKSAMLMMMKNINPSPLDVARANLQAH